MRLLLFSALCPVPARSGITHRTVSILRSLRALGHSISLATIETVSAVAERQLGEFGVDRVFSRPYSFLDHKARGLQARAVGLGLRRTLPAGGYHVTRGLRAWFADLARSERPDSVLVIDSRFGDVVRNVDPAIRRLIDTIDLESINRELWNRVSRALPTPPIESAFVGDSLLATDSFLRTDHSIDGAETARLELFDDALVICLDEVRCISACGAQVRPHWLPMALDIAEHRNSYSGHPVFVSGPNPFNIQGYLSFIRNILPTVRSAHGEFVLDVAGSCSEAVVAVDGVRHLGFVPDLDRVYQEAAFAICPVFAGTGQQVKIVEAMAHGLAVVAFASAAERSPIVHGESGLVASSPSEFAEHVIELSKSEGLRRTLGESARRTIAETCSVARQTERLAGVLRCTLERDTRMS